MEPTPIDSLRCSVAETSFNHARNIFLKDFYAEIESDLRFLVNIFKSSPLYYIAAHYLGSWYIHGRGGTALLPHYLFTPRQLDAIRKSYKRKTRMRVIHYQKHLPPVIFEELSRHILSCVETEPLNFLFFTHTEE